MSVFFGPWHNVKVVSGAPQAAELARKVVAVHPALSYKVMRKAVVVRAHSEPEFFSFKLFSDEYHVRDGEVVVGFEEEMELMRSTFC